MIRLWIQYLEPIQVLTRYIEKIGVKSVEWTGNSCGSFSDNLYRIKLKGIFEHYRHSLFRQEVEKFITKEDGTLIPNQFNSHGNSGIEYVVYPFDHQINRDRTLHPTDAIGHLRYGLQWQAGSLKLSIDVEQDNFYSEEWALSKNLNLGDVRRTRAGKLKALHEVFVTRDWAIADLRQDKNLVTKFKSYTIEKWDIFNPHLREEPATLHDLAKSYVDRLNYLTNPETQKFVRDEIKELSA